MNVLCCLLAAVDVLVLGGTSEGVAAASAAAQAGAETLLVTPYAYLGEDLVGTLELEIPKDGRPLPPLAQRLATDVNGLADYDYWPDRQTPHPRAVFKNDRWERFAEPTPPATPSECVYYESDVNCRCVLRRPAKIARVEVMVLEKDRQAPKADADSGVVQAGAYGVGFQQAAADGASRTESVTMEILSGPRRGERIELRREARTLAIPGDSGYRAMTAAIFSASVEAELREVNVCVRKDPSAHSQSLARIGFVRAARERSFANPTPLKVMRTFDRELIDAGVRFMTGTAVRRVERDATGAIAAVEVVNRSGREWIRAKKTIDATMGRAFTEASDEKGGKAKFSRVVMTDGERPSGEGLAIERLPTTYAISHVGTNDCVITGRFFRCTAEFAMSDRSYPAFAAAEWEMRARTWVRGILDDADLLVDRSRPFDDLATRLRRGAERGKTAADECKEAKPTLPLATSSTPNWGDYDVVVVGGGTAGAPAAIAAAKAGAKTLLVEYLGILGGVGTDGMILGYYDGNFCGVTYRFWEENERTGGKYGQYRRAGTLLEWCRKAGVTVWLGAMGTGAIVENGRVVGVEVATPRGSGTVRARCVIDATGNSDIAAAAGAETVPAFAGEFARQSAGQSPHRLGRGCINSDFGYVDDANAADVWLFGVRARAGAPNAWDLARLPDSRERRRIVPDYMINAMDVNAGRRYPDTVVQANSRQDSHGYLTDDFRFISSASATYKLVGVDHRYFFDVNVPLRSLLPRNLTGLAVVGLGCGVARDVLPMVRMQADLMNMGYAVGLAAARASRLGGDFRQLDWTPLREELVKEGILREEVLGWTKDVDVSSDGLIAAAVKAMAKDFDQSHVVYRSENRDRALPLLRAAYAEAKTLKLRQTYALVLGLMGDATGAETLAEVVAGKAPIAVAKVRPAAFGGGTSDMMAFMIALGRTRAACAREPLLAKLSSVRETLSMVGFRPYCLSAVEYADPALAPELERFLEFPGVSGHAVADWRGLKPTGGYGHGSVEYDEAVRELGILRALFICGDPRGRAREALEAYVRDPRGVLSAHARTILLGNDKKGTKMNQVKLSTFAVHIYEIMQKHGLTTSDAVRLLRSHGVTGFDGEYTDPRLEELAAAGLEPVMIYGVMSFRDPVRDEIEQTRYLERAKSLGAKYMMIIPDHFADLPDDPSDPVYEREFLKTVDGLRRLTAKCHAAGICPLLEDFGLRMNPGSHFGNLKRYFAAVPDLKFALDTGNVMHSDRGTDILEEFECFYPRIRHVHVKDHPAGAPQGFALPGEGVIPNARMLKRLFADGYDGWVTLELFDAPDMLKALETGARFVRTLSSAARDSLSAACCHETCVR